MLPDQRWYCSILMNCVGIGASCSTWFIVFMTLERFYSIIQPHRAASFNTVKRARIAIVCIIILSILYYSPYWLIGDNSGRYCIINNYAAQSTYYINWFSFTLNVVLPFVFLLGMNVVVICTLCQRSQLIISKSQGQGKSQGQNTNSSERQVYITLLLVTFGCLTLTAPLHGMLFWITFASGTTPYFYASYHMFCNVGEKVYYTNNRIDFFLYVMSGHKFRTNLVKLLTYYCYKHTPYSVDLNTIASSISSKTDAD